MEDYMTSSLLRSYEVFLMEDKKLDSKTVSLHLSVLSGFCRFLVKEGVLVSNPVKRVPRPKIEKKLPVFYRAASLEIYLSSTSDLFSEDFCNAFVRSPETLHGKYIYERQLSRLIIMSLYSLGLRRSELMSLTIGDVDFGRKIVKVCGKGDKMREIPLIDVLSEEFLLYLKAVELLVGRVRSLKEPLFLTYTGRKLYPNYVDRTVKKELADVEGVSGRRSPHVLRHSLATSLMNSGADLNSIKEVLGHSSLAATQVYTHTSIAELKNIYESAHPRAKNGGKHGD
jgi:integrase/recombinase XerC